MFELILSFYIFIVEKLMHDSSNESVTWPIRVHFPRNWDRWWKQFLLKNAFWVKLPTPWIAGWLHFFLGQLLCFLWLLFSSHFHFSLLDAFLATNLVSAFFGLSAVFRLRPFYCCTLGYAFSNKQNYIALWTINQNDLIFLRIRSTNQNFPCKNNWWTCPEFQGCSSPK